MLKRFKYLIETFFELEAIGNYQKRYETLESLMEFLDCSFLTVNTLLSSERNYRQGLILKGLNEKINEVY